MADDSKLAAELAMMRLVMANICGVLAEASVELIRARGGEQSAALQKTMDLLRASAQKSHDGSGKSANALAQVQGLTLALISDVEKMVVASLRKGDRLN